MLSSVDLSGKPFHFIGIGGIGMSALAYILAKRQLPVSGSDIRLNHITQRLQDLGVHIFWDQNPANLEFFLSIPSTPVQSVSAPVSITTGPGNLPTVVPDNHRMSPNGQCQIDVQAQALTQVICSSAIGRSNSEYQAALQLGLPIFHRSDLLAALIADYQSIAVAGTHGKTTTSSLIGYLLLQAGLDPTIVVGGEVSAWQGNARQGQGPYLVAEADESDGSLVKFAAQVGVITNIELDHPDHYNSLDEVIRIFKHFAQRCQTLVACIDCPTTRDYLSPTISYSLNPESGADYFADQISYGTVGTSARIWEQGRPLGQLRLQLLGQHNLSNALAAIAVGRLLNLDFPTIAEAIATFKGARRRFESYGEYGGIQFIDDYAHHPSEIAATLAAARLQARQRRIIAIFQPHRYSRITAFLSEFAQAFQDADVVIVSDIYSAGEVNRTQINGQRVADAIAAYHDQVYYQPSLQALPAYLQDVLRPGDLAIFLGAGNLNQIIPDLTAHYKAMETRVPQQT